MAEMGLSTLNEISRDERSSRSSPCRRSPKNLPEGAAAAIGTSSKSRPSSSDLHKQRDKLLGLAFR